MFAEVVFVCGLRGQVTECHAAVGARSIASSVNARISMTFEPAAARLRLLESAKHAYVVDAGLQPQINFDGITFDDCLKAGFWKLNSADDGWFDGTEGVPYP